MRKAKILIISNSAIARKILREALAGEILFYTDVAKDEKEAERKLKTGAFDIAILDITGEEKNFLRLLREIDRHCQAALVIAPEDVPEQAFSILHSEKFTYITRPGRFGASLREIKDIINHHVNRICGIPLPLIRGKSSERKYILIGSSTGGPNHIEAIAKRLPKDYPHAICVAQHMPSSFTSRFAERLNSISRIKVVEAQNGEVLEPGKMIIAKGGYHLHFMRKGKDIACKLVPNTNGRFFVPSADEMFFSALEVMAPQRIVAVLLTGIGDDGADGMVALKKLGAYTIAESEETAVVYGMPREAYIRGGAVKVLPLPDIVEELAKLGAEE